MDALEFIKERNRMCKSFGDGCWKCPAYKNSGCIAAFWEEELVPIVEKWSKENPRKTRQDVFLEQYPEAGTDTKGILRICPKFISADWRIKYSNCTHMVCPDCRISYWSQEVDPCPGYDNCKQYKSNYTTNADRIRVMSDEELAKIINAFTAYFDECNRNLADTDCHNCELCKLCGLGKEKAIDWLQQPFEGE